MRVNIRVRGSIGDLLKVSSFDGISIGIGGEFSLNFRVMISTRLISKVRVRVRSRVGGR